MSLLLRYLVLKLCSHWMMQQFSPRFHGIIFHAWYSQGRASRIKIRYQWNENPCLFIACLFVRLLAWLSAFLLACLPTCVFVCSIACLLVCPLACFLLDCLIACLLDIIIWHKLYCLLACLSTCVFFAWLLDCLLAWYNNMAHCLPKDMSHKVCSRGVRRVARQARIGGGGRRKSGNMWGSLHLRTCYGRGSRDLTLRHSTWQWPNPAVIHSFGSPLAHGFNWWRFCCGGWGRGVAAPRAIHLIDGTASARRDRDAIQQRRRAGDEPVDRAREDYLKSRCSNTVRHSVCCLQTMLNSRRLPAGTGAAAAAAIAAAAAGVGALVLFGGTCSTMLRRFTSYMAACTTAPTAAARYQRPIVVRQHSRRDRACICRCCCCHCCCSRTRAMLYIRPAMTCRRLLLLLPLLLAVTVAWARDELVVRSYACMHGASRTIARRIRVVF